MADNGKAETGKGQEPKVPPRKVDPLLRDNIMKMPKSSDKGESPSKSGHKGT